MLHSFCSRTNCGDGAQPGADLVFDPAGNLYGTTFAGGDQGCYQGGGCGVVFKLTPNSNGGWKEAVLHTFADHPGASPSAGLILDRAGNLYGTSSGFTTFGSVFEITSRVFVSANSEMREMREQSAVVRLRGQHCPLPQCGAVAEIRRNDRQLVHPARSIRKTGIAVHRWQSRLAR